MATSVAWNTGVISVPKADMPVVQVSPEIREFDVAQLHLDLRTLQAATPGHPWTVTHGHDNQRILSGFVYAEFVIIFAPYTITFEAGAYSVKVVGANHNLADVQNQNGVGIITNNSAGLINLTQAADMLYGGVVTIDLTNGNPGFTGTRGSKNDPVDNLDDALTIASRINTREFWIRAGTLTLNQNLPYWTFTGKGLAGVDVAGYDVDGGEFYDCKISGAFGGTGMCETFGCQLDGVTNIQGKHERVGLYESGGDIVLSGNTVFHDSKSFAAGPSVQPCVSMNGLPISFEARGHLGGLKLKDSTHASSVFSIDAPSAHVVVDASCTATGGGVIRGSGVLTRNDALGAAINDGGFIHAPQVVRLDSEITC